MAANVVQRAGWLNVVHGKGLWIFPRRCFGYCDPGGGVAAECDPDTINTALVDYDELTLASIGGNWVVFNPFLQQGPKRGASCTV